MRQDHKPLTVKPPSSHAASAKAIGWKGALEGTNGALGFAVGFSFFPDGRHGRCYTVCRKGQSMSMRWKVAVLALGLIVFPTSGALA